MVKKWTVTIPQLSDEERRAYVYLPASYQKKPNRRYPVLYMWDGHNVFFDEDATYGKSWGMKEYMDRSKTEMIIAAIECSRDPNNGRLKEYAPYPFEAPKIGKIESRGKLSMEWLVNEFKPYIDENYRTLPDRRNTYIAGSSMGGLMSLYAVMQYNEVFSKAACLSPSLWTNLKEVYKMIDTSHLKKGTVVYMDYGSKEMVGRNGMRKGFYETCKRLLERNVHLDARIVPGGTHCEASWEKQIPFFMNTLTYRF